MIYFAKLNFLLCLTLLCIRFSHGGYCYKQHLLYRTCSTTMPIKTSCWIFWTCTEFRLKYRTCSITEKKEVCCDGYTGPLCSTPIDASAALPGSAVETEIRKTKVLPRTIQENLLLEKRSFQPQPGGPVENP